uniref:Probable quinone oxidoreductase n=1 Tax=Daucus carota subsp. sativus TaxID=79200 RepID=A0A166A3D6_DAUCS
MEAAGVVVAVGPGLTGRKVGDLVAYAGNPMGSYAEEQILPADRVVPVPSSIDPAVAASVMLKGMTAQFLVRRCFKVEPGHTILVHAAAGGVGSLLCQWANALGATVIGTVSTTEKAAQARDDGCMEAAGVVVAVGPGLTGRKVGDLVAYAGNPMGSYAEEQILPADRVVPVPSSIDPAVAASVMLKGMTAQFLVRRCFKVEPGHTILVHAAAGGVGSLLCQWANALGATVIGTVSTTEKAAQARDDGCHHTILYKEEDVVTRVKEITSGKGVEVVYDSVGKDTFEGSLACLKTRGYLVSFGQSSGSPDPLPLSALAPKSLFLTRPSLFNYTITRDELLEAAGEVFANVASGVLKVRVNHTYPLSEAAQAQADLENRKTSGSVVLIPDGA